jgi:hypothetical protein
VVIDGSDSDPDFDPDPDPVPTFRQATPVNTEPQTATHPYSAAIVLLTLLALCIAFWAAVALIIIL